jgi:hypothetical protein
MTERQCTKCKQVKPDTDFWRDNAERRRKSHCRVCTAAASREWRRRQPNYEKQRYAAQRVETRERHLIRKYGVSLADYEAMLAKQGGQCAICLCEPSTQAHGVFHVDHCHKTGRVRGLLCRGCNHVLGHLKDDPKALRRAVEYLSVPQIPEMIGRAILQLA